MGPVPYIDVRHLWDWSRIELSDTYGTSPIHDSEISMGLVPCCVLRHLWDRSHVWLSGTYGTGPIPHMGLQNITSLNLLIGGSQGRESDARVVLVAPTKYSIVNLRSLF